MSFKYPNYITMGLRPKPRPSPGSQENNNVVFNAIGYTVSLRQGLPGCFASSVLSLDSAPAPRKPEKNSFPGKHICRHPQKTDIIFFSWVCFFLFV